MKSTLRTERRHSTEHQKRRAESILKEAEAYFVETGIADSKMEEIAERVGVSRQTLYRYYRTKEDIALAVEVRVLGSILHRLSELFSSYEGLTLKELEEKIDEHTLKFLSDYEQKIRFTALFDSYFQRYGEQQFIDAMKQTLSFYENPFRRIIEREQEHGRVCRTLDPVITGEMITHSLLSLSQRVLIRKEALESEYGFNPLHVVPLQMKIFIRGIQCSTPES